MPRILVPSDYGPTKAKPSTQAFPQKRCWPRSCSRTKGETAESYARVSVTDSYIYRRTGDDKSRTSPLLLREDTSQRASGTADSALRYAPGRTLPTKFYRTHLGKDSQRYQIETAHLSWPGAVFFAIAVNTPGIHVRAGKRPNSKANGAACGLGRCLAHGGIRPEQSWVWARFRCVAMAEVPKAKISYACSPQLPEAIICCASHRPAILVCGISLFARE